MPEMLRTFIAFPVTPTPELTAVLQTLSRMKSPVVAESADKLHVTLKFLGDTPASSMDAIRDAVTCAASKLAPFSLQLRSLGAFPHLERPSVIWSGLEPVELVKSLADRIESVVGPLGFPRESRPFSPHLTLARIKGRPPQALFDLLRDHAPSSFGTIDVSQIDWIRSELRPGGSVYSTISSNRLIG